MVPSVVSRVGLGTFGVGGEIPSSGSLNVKVINALYFCSMGTNIHYFAIFGHIHGT